MVPTPIPPPVRRVQVVRPAVGPVAYAARMSDLVRETCVMCGKPLPGGPRREDDVLSGYWSQGFQCDTCAAENSDPIRATG